ncbi:oligosaccharide flippase family protein [Pelagimonas varians]|uniref:Polysaccharide biosynthesis protein n=1 Tax=Pelagimonas varians TaxID=696760 RepID=A0A238L684_9RHOB|nr:oligosaccharide flippase family protein [Pelagimonas varians]PYG25491.1 O-antigen/teichoic acid export membrane protein [Pelagimonas varians]SMX50350.1 Polysaccharide biosynthesis protein [Pelagimonas varians]
MTSSSDRPDGSAEEAGGEGPPKKNRFIVNVAKATGVRITLMVVNLTSALILARIMGPEQYGIYIFAFAIMSLIALPGQAGLPSINVREISFRIVDRDWAGVLGIVIFTRRLVLGYSLVAGTAILAVYWFFLSDWLSAEEADAILWSALLIPAFILVNVTGANIRGLKRLLLGQLVETLFRPVLFLGFILLLVFPFGQPLDASSAMLMHACGAGFALVISLIILRWILVPKSAGLTPTCDRRAILKSIAPLTMVAGMQLILGKTDIMMLRVMRSPEEVGYYQVALQWANLALFVHQAVLMVSGPSIARAYRKGDLVAVQRTLTASARLVFLGALPLGILLLFFGEEIIGMSFGAEYIPAVSALSILLIARMVKASFGPIIQLSKMLGWENLMFGLVTVSALINVVLNYLLIPSYGIAGAAIAAVIADFFWKTALVGLAWWRLGLVSFPIGKGVQGNPSTPQDEETK